MVQKGYYVPQAFAGVDYTNKKRSAEIRYVGIRYTSIPDEEVVLTDKDYQAYYDKK
jgi:peptidyl-prolyl cis-trans isomerase D